MMPLESELLNLHTEQHCYMCLSVVPKMECSSFKEFLNYSGKLQDLCSTNWVSHT